jgi:hypothetical protein
MRLPVVVRRSARHARTGVAWTSRAASPRAAWAQASEDRRRTPWKQAMLAQHATLALLRGLDATGFDSDRLGSQRHALADLGQTAAAQALGQPVLNFLGQGVEVEQLLTLGVSVAELLDSIALNPHSVERGPPRHSRERASTLPAALLSPDSSAAAGILPSFVVPPKRARPLLANVGGVLLILWVG